MDRYFFIVAAMLLAMTMVHADAELSTLNAIQYQQGQTITLSTKILDTETAYAIEDASCGVQVLSDADNSTKLEYIDMTFNGITESYEYVWTPTLTWWEDIEQVWNPAIGDYHAYLNCSGGSLSDAVLNDSVSMSVVG